jgi:hypothetical protein
VHSGPITLEKTRRDDEILKIRRLNTQMRGAIIPARISGRISCGRELSMQEVQAHCAMRERRRASHNFQERRKQRLPNLEPRLGAAGPRANSAPSLHTKPAGLTGRQAEEEIVLCSPAWSLMSSLSPTPRSGRTRPRPRLEHFGLRVWHSSIGRTSLRL